MTKNIPDKFKFHYPHKPIYNINSLAKSLGIDKRLLIRALNQTDNQYIIFSRKKKDGSSCQLSDAKPPLKHIQHRIMENILKKIKYPLYLYGGIKDKNNPRSIMSHADLHLNKKMMSLDIKKFYPSTSKELIFSIWHNFLGFSKEISNILTTLTTKNGFLPTGIKPGTYLANLVFYDIEPSIAHGLYSKGFTYSRWVDDIFISSPTNITKHQKKLICEKIIGMLVKKGYAINRPKIKMDCKNSLSINICSKRKTLSQKERSNIRASVKKCEKDFSTNKKSTKYKNLYASAKSRVCSRLKPLHPLEAKTLLKRLEKIKPILN